MDLFRFVQNKDFKPHNEEKDSSLVTVDDYIPISCQIYQSNIYNRIKYIIRTYLCPKC